MFSCKWLQGWKDERKYGHGQEWKICHHYIHVRKGLLQNPTCAREYNDGKFSILARGRTSFHLSTLEATYMKTSKSNLCKQKEFVYGLKITH